MTKKLSKEEYFVLKTAIYDLILESSLSVETVVCQKLIVEFLLKTKMYNKIDNFVHTDKTEIRMEF